MGERQDKLRPALLFVKNEYTSEAADLFKVAGFTPISVERRSDKATLFSFGKMSGKDILRLAAAIPGEFHAKTAIIGGVPPIDLKFGDQPDQS